MHTHSLNILLIDHQTKRKVQLQQALDKLGHKSFAITDVEQAAEKNRYTDVNLIMLATDRPGSENICRPTQVSGLLDLTVIETITALTRLNKPVLLFDERAGDSTSLQQAMQAGASSYITDGLPLPRLQAIIESTLAHFSHYQQLQDELESVRHELKNRKLTERAKGLLMQHQRCNEQQAFNALRKLAMDRGKKLTDIAAEVISMFEAGSFNNPSTTA